MRLNKFIASSGISSRRDADKYIFNGYVTINGKVVKEPGFQVYEAKDIVKLNNKRVVVSRKRKYIKLYKPAGFLSSIDKKDTLPNLLNLLDFTPGLKPLGRLDFNTEGLLILTNDGDFIYKMSHPRFEVPRRYYVKIWGNLSDEELDIITTGVEIEKGVVVKLDGIESGKILKSTSWWFVVVHEGKYHEIKKIFEAVGHKVIRLIRLSFGDIELGDLKVKESRNFSKDELSFVRKIKKQ